jgi:hypothetical protein
MSRKNNLFQVHSVPLKKNTFKYQFLLDIINLISVQIPIRDDQNSEQVVNLEARFQIVVTYKHTIAIQCIRFNDFHIVLLIDVVVGVKVLIDLFTIRIEYELDVVDKLLVQVDYVLPFALVFLLKYLQGIFFKKNQVLLSLNIYLTL